VHLAATTAPVVERAAEFTQVVRAAASSAFRASLLDKGRPLVEALGRDAAQAEPEPLREVLTHLLRAAEALPGPSVTLLADVFLTGLQAAQRPEAPAALAEALAPALRAAPGGAFWALQLIMYLAVRGEEAASQRTAQVLEALLCEARTQSLPLIQTRRTPVPRGQAAPEAPPPAEPFDQASALAARLMPACGAMYALRERLPPTLAEESLLLLASLDQVGASATGQQVLRQALLAQERGDWTFLSIVPQVAQALAHKDFTRVLRARKLAFPAYPPNATAYTQEVALRTADSLGAPVIAWSQKGEAAAARSLLRTALYINAHLFGLSPEAVGDAVGLFEDLRARPKPRYAQRLNQQLLELAVQHPTADRMGSVRSLKGLIHALAHRDPTAAPTEVRARAHNEDAPRMTSLEIAAVQTTLVKERVRQQEAEQEAKRKAAAPRSKKPPPRTPGAKK